MIEDQIACEVAAADANEAEAYLGGAAHDSTFSSLHGTTRFCQADPRWLTIVGRLLEKLGRHSWTYREGQNRSLWVLETTWHPYKGSEASALNSAAYVRGYFDAEGGIPTSPEARFYIQLVQKNHADLSDVRSMLLGLEITCGRLHNPSVRVDPNYWRFYVASSSHAAFIDRVGSWHPRKRCRLEIERDRSGAGERIPQAAPGFR